MSTPRGRSRSRAKSSGEKSRSVSAGRAQAEAVGNLVTSKVGQAKDLFHQARGELGGVLNAASDLLNPWHKLISGGRQKNSHSASGLKQCTLFTRVVAAFLTVYMCNYVHDRYNTFSVTCNDKGATKAALLSQNVFGFIDAEHAGLNALLNGLFLALLPAALDLVCLTRGQNFGMFFAGIKHVHKNGSTPAFLPYAARIVFDHAFTAIAILIGIALNTVCSSLGCKCCAAFMASPYFALSLNLLSIATSAHQQSVSDRVFGHYAVYA